MCKRCDFTDADSVALFRALTSEMPTVIEKHFLASATYAQIVTTSATVIVHIDEFEDGDTALIMMTPPYDALVIPISELDELKAALDRAVEHLQGRAKSAGDLFADFISTLNTDDMPDPE